MPRRIIPLLFLLKVALGDVHRIHNASELVEFSESVNSGVNFTGTTVFLDSDIDFTENLSQEFEPIGFLNRSEDIYYFSGVFDGQGHTISNLRINSSSNNIGLFGYSTGATIKNVVIDDSCTMSSFGSSNTYMGGIIGNYISANSLNVENCVNMASILFEGNNEYGKLYIGGIIGSIILYENLNDFTVKNCANYGSVTYSGKGENIYIGGIIGDSGGSSPSKSHIQNCLNYGYIIYNETSGIPYIGGIAGGCSNTEIENCVSAGLIISSIKTSENIGAIVGLPYGGDGSLSTVIKKCFWTSDAGYNASCGLGSISFVGKTIQVDLDMDFLDDLNNYSSTNSWNGWLLNTNNASTTFIINNGKGFTIGSEVILLPDPADNNENSFSGWFNDVYLSSPLNSSAITTETTLYGMLCGSDYSVTLDVNGGDPSSIPASHPMGIECNGVYGNLPTPSRVGYTFSGWFNDVEGGANITSGSSVNNQDNHTLYAHWTPNNYTVSFDVKGGDELMSTTKEVTFNSSYGDLPSATRTGYTFSGWFTENNESITSESIMSLAENHTLYAHWVINQYTVTFNANGGDKPTYATKEVTFNSSYGDLPEATRTGYTFSGWFTEKNENIASESVVNSTDNHVLYAHWTSNNYTVTFNVNGGDEPTYTTKEVTFNSSYGDLPTPNRENYTFIGWYTEKNESITNECVVKIAINHTLYAHWKEVPTSYVEIVFGTKELSEKRVKEIIGQHTDTKFEIVGFEKTDSGKTIVIIKFSDPKEAESFVDVIKMSSDSTATLVEEIGYGSAFISFSQIWSPLILLTAFML